VGASRPSFRGFAQRRTGTQEQRSALPVPRIFVTSQMLWQQEVLVEITPLRLVFLDECELHERRHFLISFSRAIADGMSPCCSRRTRVLHPYFREKPEATFTMTHLFPSFRTREARSGTQGPPLVRSPLASGFGLRPPRNDGVRFSLLFAGSEHALTAPCSPIWESCHAQRD
jgi:hypothetical protein